MKISGEKEGEGGVMEWGEEKGGGRQKGIGFDWRRERATVDTLHKNEED